MSGISRGVVLSLTLLLVGIALLVWAAQASDSFASGFSRIFTGSPTDETMWLTIGGMVAVVLGVAGLIRAGIHRT